MEGEKAHLKGVANIQFPADPAKHEMRQLTNDEFMHCDQQLCLCLWRPTCLSSQLSEFWQQKDEQVVPMSENGANSVTPRPHETMRASMSFESGLEVSISTPRCSHPRSSIFSAAMRFASASSCDASSDPGGRKRLPIFSAWPGGSTDSRAHRS